ncbi:MAG: glycoside hydrolase family 127 protein [Candidatus Hydrogenedentes bacterium]|nr:glycoside hydrolase family 127 protein [Candidatus Hydrogenedentota bacterium]
MYRTNLSILIMALPSLVGDFGAAAEALTPLTPLDVRAIKVQGLIGERIAATIKQNLLNLNVDQDFLRPFLVKEANDGYVGLGKFIDSLVRFAAYSGDARVVALKEHVIGEALRAQEPDGYLGIMKPDRRMWTLWDLHEMSYLVYGLTMDHRFFQSREALAGARKIADYILSCWEKEPERQPGNGEITEYMAATGLEAALLALYGETGDERYLKFVVEQRKLAEWDGPIVLGRWGPIQGHAYAYLCRGLAQLRLYQLDPQPQLLVPTRRALDFLLADDGLAITGTLGQHECWHNTQEGAANLGETCATAYFVRILDELMRTDGQSLYGDLMERAVYNALFAAQSPDGRQIRYYTPFEGKRVYFDKDTYCCPCNYRRIIAELPGMIYYQSGEGITVNLYSASQAMLTLESGIAVQLAQESAYPKEENVAIHVNPAQSVEFTLTLRIPGWCAAGSVLVNGEAVGPAQLSPGYFPLRRTWSPGDRVEVSLPMPLRLVRGRVAQAGRVAVMRGPVVYCLNREQNPALTGEDLRLITLKPDTLALKAGDGGIPVCTVDAWRTTAWYPHAAPDWTLTLTPFSDPGGEATYFHVPNPQAPEFVDDELIGRQKILPPPSKPGQ